MQPKSDAQLLRDYAECGTEAAFDELVHRHTNLVYSAALRQVNSPDAAAEIAQRVFIALARGAQELTPRLAAEASLAGWLCRVARNLSLKFRRDEFRRLSCERENVPQMTSVPDPTLEWERLRPVLDDAMSRLSESEYDALVLRFFQNEDFRSVGVALGVSDDTAQKRVTRAVEKLRRFLRQRGVVTSSSALSVLIAANAVHAAPIGLAVAISSASALAEAAVSTTTLIAATKTIAMTTLQKTLVTFTVTVLAGTGIYEARHAAQLRERVQTLQQEQAPLAAKIGRLQSERDDAVSRLAAVHEDTNGMNNQALELARLRGEVQRLRTDSQELEQLKAGAANPAGGSNPAIEATLRSWAARADQMKRRLADMPELRIPELNLLTDKEWLDAAKNLKQLDTTTDYRQGFQRLRDTAKNAFGELLRPALKQFAAENQGLLPTDLSQLQTYFERAVDDDVLQRYTLLQSGKLSDMGRNYLVAEKAPPVDDEYDSAYQFSLDGTQSRSIDKTADLVLAAMMEQAKANNGQLSRNPAELTPYLARPIDQSKIQRLLAEIPPSIVTVDQLNAARNSR